MYPSTPFHVDVPLEEISGTGVDAALARTLVSAASTTAAPVATPLTLYFVRIFRDEERCEQESLIASKYSSWVACDQQLSPFGNGGLWRV